MKFCSLVTALLAGFVPASAQIISYTPSIGRGVSYKVNIPEETASTGTGPIYFQLQAPSDLKWVALGQGYLMTNGNLFVMYSGLADNVTLSPRRAHYHIQPLFNPDIQAYVLEGSGIRDGMMTANVRCDNCLHLFDGKSVLGSSSNWIWATNVQDNLRSDDPEATIYQHDLHGIFTLDLTLATGGYSENPFIADSGYVDVDYTPYSTQQQINDWKVHKKRIAHGTLSALAFVFFFPNNALLLYLWPSRWTVPYIHAPLQMLALLLAMGGLGVGVSVANDLQEPRGYHTIIGYILVSSVVLVQPFLGIMQHIKWRKFKQKTLWGLWHRWFGRVVCILGFVNGGIGFHYAQQRTLIPLVSPVLYAFITAGIGITYIYVVWKRRMTEKALQLAAQAKVVYEGGTDRSSSQTTLCEDPEYVMEKDGPPPWSPATNLPQHFA